MKSTFTKILLAFCFIAISSCEDDVDPKVSAGGFALRSTEVTPVVLTPANDDNVVATFNWDKSNNGMSSVSSYQIQIAVSGTNFENAVTGNNNNNITTADRSYILKFKELNQLVNQLPGFQCGQEMSIDVRIKSTLGQGFYNGFVQYSTNVITLRATPYSIAPLKLAIVETAQNPNQSVQINSSSFLSQTDYEGFVYLTAGNYKLYQPDACGNFSSGTVFGISGGNSGTLVQDGTTTYNVPADGHYFIKANVTAGTYSISPFNNTTASNVLGIFGNATKVGIGFANTTPMTYDAQTKKWSVTINLVDGKKFSFKTGNSNPIAAVLTGTGSAVIGVNNSVSVSSGAIDNTGSIKAPGTYVDDNTKTKYNIVLDLSTPRHYYYTLEVNPN